MGTVYRKEIVQGEVTTTDDEVLERFGLKGAMQFSATDPNQSIRFYSWLPEDECVQKELKLRAPKGGSEVSALVHAPVGIEEEKLIQLLENHNIDLSKWGQETKSLRAFASELIKGEAAIAELPDGSLRRIVDIVV